MCDAVVCSEFVWVQAMPIALMGTLLLVSVALGHPPWQTFTARLLRVPLGCHAGSLSLGRFWKHTCIQH